MSALKIQVMHRQPQLLRDVLNKIIPLMSPVKNLDMRLHKHSITMFYIIFIFFYLGHMTDRALCRLYDFQQAPRIIIVNT